MNINENRRKEIPVDDPLIEEEWIKKNIVSKLKGGKIELITCKGVPMYELFRGDLMREKSLE